MLMEGRGMGFCWGTTPKSHTEGNQQSLKDHRVRQVVLASPAVSHSYGVNKFPSRSPLYISGAVSPSLLPFIYLSICIFIFSYFLNLHIEHLHLSVNHECWSFRRWTLISLFPQSSRKKLEKNTWSDWWLDSLEQRAKLQLLPIADIVGFAETQWVPPWLKRARHAVHRNEDFCDFIVDMRYQWGLMISRRTWW